MINQFWCTMINLLIFIKSEKINPFYMLFTDILLGESIYSSSDVLCKFYTFYKSINFENLYMPDQQLFKINNKKEWQ